MANIPLKHEPSADDDLTLFPEAAHLPPVGGEVDPDENWLARHEEAKLMVDVYETDAEIVIRSAIAGVRPEDLEVFTHNDMLTIRGRRPAECSEMDQGARHLVRECHWGSFSRSVILPAEVDADDIAAELKNGVFTVRLPKVERSRKINVKET